VSQLPVSQLIEAVHIEWTPSPSLRVAMSALFGALLLAMLAGTASAQGDSSIGRGFTGVVMSVDIANGFMVVESKTAVFQLLLTEDTVISVHPDKDVGLEGLPITTRYKIAGLADLPITDAGGNVDLDPRTAQKITVIPGNATRSHRRAIAAGIQDDDLTTLDFGGTKTELAGRRDGIEKGEMLIMLIQRSARGDAEEKVRGLFRAQTVDGRLVPWYGYPTPQWTTRFGPASWLKYATGAPTP